MRELIEEYGETILVYVIGFSIIGMFKGMLYLTTHWFILLSAQGSRRKLDEGNSWRIWRLFTCYRSRSASACHYHNGDEIIRTFCNY